MNGSRVKSFFTSNFYRSQFCSPCSFYDESGSFESSNPYLLALNLKNSLVPLLTSVRMFWKVPIYYINGVLVILIWTALYIFPFLLVWFLLLINKCWAEQFTRCILYTANFSFFHLTHLCKCLTSILLTKKYLENYIQNKIEINSHCCHLIFLKAFYFLIWLINATTMSRMG